MGLLKPARVRGKVLLGLAALVAGCTVFDAILPDEAPSRRFDHRVHVEDEGLECYTCHVGAEDLERPGMPALGQCRLCHDEPESEDEVDLAAGLFDERGAFAHAPFSALSAEVTFSHLTHVSAELDCAACHGDVTETPRLDASVGVSMAECIACHDARQAPNECATCHTEVSRDWAPPSHAHGWTKAHGPASAAREAATGAQCSLCHEQSTCTSCHLENPPESHTNYWRRRGHGASAALDRVSCMTCHKRDSCVECHSQTQPASHVGQWGGRRSTHCGSCHLPSLAEEGCALCHKGAPSHALATPLPPDHVPGMNCRQCHGVGAPLPHVDNGDSCSACHK
jgi:predicted CxxxxCH...CXXCH cytochrome family protein